MARNFFSTSEKRFVDMNVNLDDVNNALAIRSLLTLTEFSGIGSMVSGFVDQLPIANSGESLANAELRIGVTEYLPTGKSNGIKLITAKDVESNFDLAIDRLHTAILKSPMAVMADMQINMFRQSANPIIIFTALKQYNAIDSDSDETYKLYLVTTPDDSIMVRISKADTVASVMELAVKELSSNS